MKKNLKIIRKARDTNEIMTLNNREQVELLKNTYAKGATDIEFRMLIAVGNRVNADPFKREIYLIPFWDRNARKMSKTPVVGIDWYRKQAGKSKNYAGQGEAEFGEKIQSNGIEHPDWAVVPIYNRNFEHPIRVKVFWDEIVKLDKQGNALSSWRTMPRTMLAKCSEAQGIRRAFPEEVGGVYTEDEMVMPEGTVIEAEVVGTNADQLKPQIADKINFEQKKQIKKLLIETGKSKTAMLEHYSRATIDDFTGDEANTIIKLLEGAPKIQNEEKKVVNKKPIKMQEERSDEMPPPIEEMPEIEKKPKQIKKKKPGVGGPLSKARDKALEKKKFDKLHEWPEDVCKFVRFIEEIYDDDLPDDIVQLKKDAKKGEWYGYEHYPSLKKGIETIPEDFK